MRLFKDSQIMAVLVGIGILWFVQIPLMNEIFSDNCMDANSVPKSNSISEIRSVEKYWEIQEDTFVNVTATHIQSSINEITVQNITLLVIGDSIRLQDLNAANDYNLTRTHLFASLFAYDGGKGYQELKSLNASALTVENYEYRYSWEFVTDDPVEEITLTMNLWSRYEGISQMDSVSYLSLFFSTIQIETDNIHQWEFNLSTHINEHELDTIFTSELISSPYPHFELTVACSNGKLGGGDQIFYEELYCVAHYGQTDNEILRGSGWVYPVLSTYEYKASLWVQKNIFFTANNTSFPPEVINSTPIQGDGVSDAATSLDDIDVIFVNMNNAYYYNFSGYFIKTHGAVPITILVQKRLAIADQAHLLMQRMVPVEIALGVLVAGGLGALIVFKRKQK